MLLERDIVDVSVVLAPHAYTIDDVIDWGRRDPWVGDLLRQQEAAVMAQGPDIMAARVAEAKRFLEKLPAREALALINACAAARARRLDLTRRRC